MARAIHKLSSKTVEAAAERGLYSDGGGLYLQITQHGHRSWVYGLRIHGKLRTMGLGPYPRVTLKKARDLAKAAAEQVHDEIDPIVARGQSRIAAAKSLTIKQAATAYVTGQRAKWKTKKYADQIEQRLKDYVYPVIGHLPVADIRFAEIKQVLAPIWLIKNPTAGRVRSYLEAMIDWAIAEGHRTDESNPAEIKRLKFFLPVGVRKVRHFPSLPHSEAPSFLADLRDRKGVKAQGARVRHAHRRAHRRHLRRRQGRSRCRCKWSHLDLAPASYGSCPTPRWAGLIPFRSAPKAVPRHARRDAAIPRSDNRLSSFPAPRQAAP